MPKLFPCACLIEVRCIHKIRRQLEQISRPPSARCGFFISRFVISRSRIGFYDSAYRSKASNIREKMDPGISVNEGQPMEDCRGAD